MSTSRAELLRWQFDLTWALTEFHLAQLTPADFGWEPGRPCWTMRPDADGGWVADFAEVEPDPVPVPTIAWLTWHVGWWWSVTIDHAQGRTPRDRTEIAWPGPGAPTIDWLRGLRDEWAVVSDRLTDADLDAPAPFPWRDSPELTVAHMLAWVNTELTKNVAEIGQLRLLRAASAG
ncbi:MULTISPECIES: DinB family protein [Actinoalloteichus]|uniref:DinB superfamily n=1 Tax=Actinoalloteichus fjordicus TaxID=1612552 RepID=A0AAC9LBV8_9PSEU|nr:MULTISPECIES: DinB family protein [Actinoalloteichus]APU14923.1 DinB superfamily [Actinoalloteichus fjordicus]APU20993.1 DinB superfamily [Actinoalloteichus sp. GBA129-24]